MAFDNTVLTQHADLMAGEVLKSKPHNVEAFELFADGLVEGRFCRFDTADNTIKNLSGTATPTLAGITRRKPTGEIGTGVYSTSGPEIDSVAEVINFGWATVTVTDAADPDKYDQVYAVNDNTADAGKATEDATETEVPGAIFWEEKQDNVWLVRIMMDVGLAGLLEDKISHDLATAENDFLVGAPTPFGTFVKKTLAQTKTILGWLLTSTVEAVGFTISGGTTSRTLTVDETKAISDKVDKTSIAALDIAATDNGDETATVTIQAVDLAGTNLAANVLTRVWLGGADDYDGDAITDLAVSDGTVKEIVAAEEENLIITDDTGLITLVLTITSGTDTGGTTYLWAELGGNIYEAGAIVITGASS